MCKFEGAGLEGCDTVSFSEQFQAVRGSWFLHLQGQVVKEDLILVGLYDPEDVRYY
jgi:hypothetical protein